MNESERETADRSMSARDALIDRDRIRGASRVIPEGAEPSTVSADQVQQVADDATLFCRTHGITRKQLAIAIGYNAGVVSSFLNGSYAGNRPQLAIDVESWLVEQEQRRESAGSTQFVWTSVAMEIKAVATYCLDKRTIGMVYGPDSSGVGKTTSLRAIRQEMGANRCTLVTVDKVDANPSGICTKIAKALHVDHSGSTSKQFSRIVAKLTGRSHLLLIDQIHNLRGAKEDRPFYILTDLFDATQTAQLWCGTADLVGYLQRQQRRNADESLAQIRRRIFPCVDLMESLRGGGEGDGGGDGRLVTVEQIREVFARHKLKQTSSAIRWLCTIANLPDGGGLGVCVRVVEYASMMAELQNVQSIDVPLLNTALRRGFTVSRADALMKEFEAESPPQKMRVG